MFKIANNGLSLRWWASCIALIGLSLLVACSSQAAGTNPDDMSAEEHQAAAEAHEATAEKHAEDYDPEARTAGPPVSDDPFRGAVYGLETYNPTEYHHRMSERHQDHARQHREAGETLLAFEEESCGKFPAETRAECPLMGQVQAVEDVDGGVQLNFREGVSLAAVEAHMKCHFAYARTQGYEGMDSCPLYLRGLSIESDAESHTVTVTTTDSAVVESLRQRSREHALPVE